MKSQKCYERTRKSISRAVEGANIRSFRDASVRRASENRKLFESDDLLQSEGDLFFGPPVILPI